MTTSIFKLSGVYPPVLTPMKEGSEEVDYEAFEKLLHFLDRHPLAGFVILGSNGESAYLSTSEKEALVKTARSILGPQKTIIAGVSAETTRESIDLVKRMVDAGADAVLVLNPFYFRGRMTAPALIQHFRRVADASPVPVILYTVPGHTMMDIPLEAVVELAKHPNIVGIKESGDDFQRIANVMRLTSGLGKPFQVLVGNPTFLLPAFMLGCVGTISALANTLPGELCRLLQFCEDGKWTEARELQNRIVPANTACAIYQVPGLKMALSKLFGVPMSSTVRSPMQQLTSEEFEKLTELYNQAGHP